MTKSERMELEKARQKCIRWHNEAVAEQARVELSRAFCGKRCRVCDPMSCPQAQRVGEIPE